MHVCRRIYVSRSGGNAFAELSPPLPLHQYSIAPCLHCAHVPPLLSVACRDQAIWYLYKITCDNVPPLCGMQGPTDLSNDPFAPPPMPKEFSSNISDGTKE